MKKKNLLTIATCLMAAFMMTSCFNDDDDNGLTPEQIGQCLNASLGVYNGKMIYAAENAANSADQTDTLNMAWSVTTDTTVVIRNFPSERLAYQVSDPDLKAAIEAAPPVDITCKMYFYAMTPISFLLYPQKVTYNLTYGGQSHKVDIYFYTNNVSYGVKSTSSTSTIFQMQLVEGYVMVDGSTKPSESKLPSGKYNSFFFATNIK